jgi:predicted pyridoxine 5'-phosphate oxidase superfamily flavin-nucleotide-binding protein
MDRSEGKGIEIPEETLRLIAKSGNVVLIGSVDTKGIPNISPRFVLGVLEGGRLLFADAFQNKTLSNLKAWNKVTAAVLDRDTMGGYQLKGEAVEVDDANLVVQANAKLKEFGFDNKPHRVWTLVVSDIFSLEPSEKSRLPLISAYS